MLHALTACGLNAADERIRCLVKDGADASDSRRISEICSIHRPRRPRRGIFAHLPVFWDNEDNFQESREQNKGIRAEENSA